MGGCVVSLMDSRNHSHIVPNENVMDFRAIGDLALPLPGTEAGQSSPIYRIAGIDAEEHERLCHEWPNGLNLTQRFDTICGRNPKQRALAYRPIDRVEQEEVVGGKTETKKTTNITYFKETQYITFETLWEYITCFGRGLVELGIPSEANIAIYEETRWEWLATIYGIWTQSMVVVTVYANLGEDALAYALHETQCRAIICNAKRVASLVKFMTEGRAPKAPIIYNGVLPPSFDDKGCKVLSWEAVVEKGREAVNRVPLQLPINNNHLALIMYTSGTTGNPKGVMHTHGSLMSGVEGLGRRLLQVVGPFEKGETYCAYLPLAHIMEFAVLNIFVARGALICFGTPFTLTNLTARPQGDLLEFNPVFMIGVPRVYDTLKKAVEAKLPPVGTLKRSVFDHAYASRLQSLKEGNDTPYWNEKVFAASRAVLGKNIRAVLSGGAPLSAATQDFVNVAFAPIIQGWGLTETVCIGGCQRLGDLETNATGQMELTEELRLLDVDEYKHTDKPEPRGEILLRGPFLFKGYYKQEKLTREAIDEDGWFHTGDVGSIGPNGTLRIIGRVKALVKNVLGEYIALEALESMYAHNSLCMPNGVCVVVNPEKSYICALALTDESKTLDFAKEHGIEGSYPAILEDQVFRRKATESMQATARMADRQRFECVRHVRFLADEWTPENDVLTAAGKLKRRVIDKRYADTIKSLFLDE